MEHSASNSFGGDLKEKAEDETGAGSPGGSPGGSGGSGVTEPPAGSGASAASTNDLPPPDNVKFFIVGFRHGNRNPAQWLKGDTTHTTWAWEGGSQLTNIGKRQAYTLGQFLRKRYGKMIGDEYYPDQVKAWSSSAERAQQTLQSCFAGFFPPRGRSVWNPALIWTPIPYEINDPLLRMYNVKCPHYTEAYQGISDDNDKATREWLGRDPALNQYISKNSGLNASLSDLADVSDNIGNMKLFGATLPDWVTKPTLAGYPPKDMFAAVMSFAEAHQIICAADSECARMMAGNWLDNVIETLQSLKNGTLKVGTRLAQFYACHTETVLSLIRLMKAEDVPDNPTTAGLILEYTDTPAPAVRFIFHEPDPNNPDVRFASLKELPYCKGQQWCPLDTFISSIKAPSFADWQGACKLPKCPT